MRKLNNQGSAVPLILFVLTIFVAGALYSLFFIEVGFGLLDIIPVPDSDSKTAIMMGLYGIPLIILIVGIIALFLSALKNENMYYWGGG